MATHIPHPPQPKAQAAGSPPRKDREQAVKHMLMLRAAGILRRLARQRDDALGITARADSQKKAAQLNAPQAMLMKEVELWLIKANKGNATDRLVVPTDAQLLQISSGVLDQMPMPASPRKTRPPGQPQFVQSAREVSNRNEKEGVLPALASPRAVTPRGLASAPASVPAPPKSPRMPDLGGSGRPKGYLAAPTRPEPSEEDLIREMKEDEERILASHKKGINEKRAADLWAQLSALESENYIKEQRERKMKGKQVQAALREDLTRQVEDKTKRKMAQLIKERDEIRRQEAIQAERAHLETQIEEARKRRHEAEQQELHQQMREAQLVKRKNELKNKLMEHQTKKAAEAQMAAEAERQTAKRLERERIAFEAVAQNEELKKVREAARLVEVEHEKEVLQAAKAAAEAYERSRLQHLERIHQKQHRSIQMSNKLQASLEEQANASSVKAQAELVAINKKKEREAKEEKRRRDEAKVELRRALKEQIEEHHRQQDAVRVAGLEEKQQVAEQAARRQVEEEEAKAKRKEATRRNRKEIQDQIAAKNARLAYEATRNMTVNEMAFNKAKLVSLSEPRERSEAVTASVA